MSTQKLYTNVHSSSVYNSHKMETLQSSSLINNRVLFIIKKEQTMHAQTNMNESQNNYSEWKNPGMKEYILCFHLYYIYIFWGEGRAMPVACRSSGARDWTCTIAAARAADNRILNPLSHQGTLFIYNFRQCRLIHSDRNRPVVPWGTKDGGRVDGKGHRATSEIDRKAT